jgi:hypothetical protein
MSAQYTEATLRRINEIKTKAFGQSYLIVERYAKRAIVKRGSSGLVTSLKAINYKLVREAYDKWKREEPDNRELSHFLTQKESNEILYMSWYTDNDWPNNPFNTVDTSQECDNSVKNIYGRVVNCRVEGDPMSRFSKCLSYSCEKCNLIANTLQKIAVPRTYKPNDVFRIFIEDEGPYRENFYLCLQCASSEGLLIRERYDKDPKIRGWHFDRKSSFSCTYDDTEEQKTMFDHLRYLHRQLLKDNPKSTLREAYDKLPCESRYTTQTNNCVDEETNYNRFNCQNARNKRSVCECHGKKRPDCRYKYRRDSLPPEQILRLIGACEVWICDLCFEAELTIENEWEKLRAHDNKLLRRMIMPSKDDEPLPKITTKYSWCRYLDEDDGYDTKNDDNDDNNNDDEARNAEWARLTK